MHFALLSPFGLTGKRFAYPVCLVPCAVSNGSVFVVSCTPRSTLVYQHCTSCASAAQHCVLINLKLFESGQKKANGNFFHCLRALLREGFLLGLVLLLTVPSAACSFCPALLLFSLFLLLCFLPNCIFATRFFLPSYGRRRCAPRWAPNEFHFTDAARARNFIRCQTEFASIAPVAKVFPSPLASLAPLPPFLAMEKVENS